VVGEWEVFQPGSGNSLDEEVEVHLGMGVEHSGEFYTGELAMDRVPRLLTTDITGGWVGGGVDQIAKEGMKSLAWT